MATFKNAFYTEGRAHEDNVYRRGTITQQNWLKNGITDSHEAKEYIKQGFQFRPINSPGKQQCENAVIVCRVKFQRQTVGCAIAERCDTMVKVFLFPHMKPLEVSALAKKLYRFRYPTFPREQFEDGEAKQLSVVSLPSDVAKGKSAKWVKFRGFHGVPTDDTRFLQAMYSFHIPKAASGVFFTENTRGWAESIIRLINEYADKRALRELWEQRMPKNI